MIIYSPVYTDEEESQGKNSRLIFILHCLTIRGMLKSEKIAGLQLNRHYVSNKKIMELLNPKD